MIFEVMVGECGFWHLSLVVSLMLDRGVIAGGGII